MMPDAPNGADLRATILKLALIEGVLLAIGVVFFFVYDTIWGLVAAAVIGSALFANAVIREALRQQKSNDKL